jgi:hypothetical protein
MIAALGGAAAALLRALRAQLPASMSIASRGSEELYTDALNKEAERVRLRHTQYCCERSVKSGGNWMEMPTAAAGIDPIVGCGGELRSTVELRSRGLGANVWASNLGKADFGEWSTGDPDALAAMRRASAARMTSE